MVGEGLLRCTRSKRHNQRAGLGEHHCLHPKVGAIRAFHSGRGSFFDTAHPTITKSSSTSQ
jgi:hypothetical protein